MKLKLPEKLWQLQWHLLFAGLSVAALILLVLAAVFTVLRSSFLVMLYFAAATGVFAIILLVHEVISSLKEQAGKLEQINDSIAANKTLLEQICHVVKMSEAAKTIVYRDMDRQQLRAGVVEKLHQQDFNATDAMIDDIARRSEYKQLADELKDIADKYRNATDQERVNQVINYIERLLEQHQWTAASIQIERLLKFYPDSEKAKNLPYKLIERKEQRKRELLDAWDQAVKKSDTNSSLEILRALDLYLTPSEGLALQEAASEVFKNKLHSLGVRFALAVSDKHWLRALETGQEIIRDFPNSRMADEIRSKMTILRERAKK
jgi:predicted S18 family serine protease